MVDKKKLKLFKVSRELNRSVPTLVEYLRERGFDNVPDANPNAKITAEMYEVLLEAFAEDREKVVRHEQRVRQIKERKDEERVDERVTLEEVVTEEEVVVEAVEDGMAEEVDVVESEAAVEEAEEAVIEAEEPEEAALAVSSDEAVASVEEVPVAEEAVEASEIPEETQEEVEEPSAEVSEELLIEQAESTVEVDSEEEELPEAVTSVSVEEGGSVEEQEGDVEAVEEQSSVIRAGRYQLKGPKVVGTVSLEEVKDVDKTKKKGEKKKKRKRKEKKVAETPDVETLREQLATAFTEGAPAKGRKKGKRKHSKVDEQEVAEALHKTMQEMERGSGMRVRKKRRKQRREERAQEREQEVLQAVEESKKIKVPEFVTTSELAEAMNVPVNDLIAKGFEFGLMITINQRLDADTITLLADEFGYDVEFVTELTAEDLMVEEDNPEDLKPRHPVVTIMGHVDHGKTSLLDYIRKTNVVAGEAGGITQHIGAYVVEMEDGRKITFLDTPGHEAFTAMRARGAQVTDVVVLVVAADDSVMPQTIEAINHAKAAGVPIVVAINKIDKPEANPDKVLQQLAEHGVLCEQYGGQVQCAQVSAKTGVGIDELLEKILLEAEILELKANPNRRAVGTIIESKLDKGRGVTATVLVKNGTLRVGDSFVAGLHHGRVRAMFDERDNRVQEAGPATPVLVIGFEGQPEVGDQLVVVESEREARSIAQRRQRIWREQKLHQTKHIRLDDLSRQLALGNLKELNLIVKADVAGSAEALTDALYKLSNDEVRVNVIHKGVGAITESDVHLAAASNAIIIGFQVRPTAGARRLAEREEIDIRLYSVIYQAIEDVRNALEGLLEPEEVERVTGLAEVREVFRVPKVGTVAGAYVLEGKIRRNDRARVIREGVVIYEGKIASLKRFKEDVREVLAGYECGIGIENFNDIKVGDQIEAYEVVEARRRLEANVE